MRLPWGYSSTRQDAFSHSLSYIPVPLRKQIAREEADGRYIRPGIEVPERCDKASCHHTSHHPPIRKAGRLSGISVWPSPGTDCTTPGPDCAILHANDTLP